MKQISIYTQFISSKNYHWDYSSTKEHPMCNFLIHNLFIKRITCVSMCVCACMYIRDATIHNLDVLIAILLLVYHNTI